MIVYGKSADGSGLKVFSGFYTNPNNPNEWSSTPYPGTNKQSLSNSVQDIFQYQQKTGYTFHELYIQIKDKRSKLCRRLRDFVLSHYDENGTFKHKEIV
jgi:hypothetical protein